MDTSIVLSSPREEFALSLNGKKNRLKRQDIVDYFGRGRLGPPQGLLDKVLDKVLKDFVRVRTAWEALIDKKIL